MSVEVMGLVFHAAIGDLPYEKDGKQHNVRGQTAKLMLLAYADHANDEGEAAYPGYSLLEIKTSLSRQSIADTLLALQQNGFMTYVGKSKRDTNSYQINLEKLRLLVKFPEYSKEPVKQPDSPESSSLTSTSQAKTILEAPEKAPKAPGKVSEKTRQAVTAAPGWAILAGQDYVPDPEQIALETVRQTWDKLMRINSRWERWGAFDKWLLQQERDGRRISDFCAWFMADTYRRKTVGNWTPKGDAQGRWSFMAIYPQAFPQSVEQPVQPSPAPAPDPAPHDEARRLALRKAWLEKMHTLMPLAYGGDLTASDFQPGMVR